MFQLDRQGSSAISSGGPFVVSRWISGFGHSPRAMRIVMARISSNTRTILGVSAHRTPESPHVASAPRSALPVRGICAHMICVDAKFRRRSDEVRILAILRTEVPAFIIVAWMPIHPGRTYYVPNDAGGCYVGSESDTKQRISCTAAEPPGCVTGDVAGQRGEYDRKRSFRSRAARQRSRGVRGRGSGNGPERDQPRIA